MTDSSNSSNWIDVAHVHDLEAGKWHEVEINLTSILIFHLNNDFYAIENLCTHDGGPLTDGRLEGEEIVCSRHGAKFCIKTGAVTAPPAYEDLKTFPVRVENNKIQIQL